MVFLSSEDGQLIAIGLKRCVCTDLDKVGEVNVFILFFTDRLRVLICPQPWKQRYALIIDRETNMDMDEVVIVLHT